MLGRQNEQRENKIKTGLNSVRHFCKPDFQQDKDLKTINENVLEYCMSP